MPGSFLAAGLDPMTSGQSTWLDPMHDDGGGSDPNGIIVADSLRRSRAQTDDSGAGTLRVKTTGRRRPVDANQTIWQWSPWVRREVARSELQSRVRRDGNALHVLVADGTSATAVTLHPPSDPVLNAEVLSVLARTEVRGDRTPEICVQSGTLWPFWSAVTHITPDAAPKAFELISTCLTTCSAMVMAIKHGVAAPRPIDVSPYVQPIVDTPGHGSLPSGHATAGWFFLTLVSRLLDLEEASPVRVQLARLAERIADNRVVAGVHFPIDSAAGKLMGEVLANYFISVATGQPASFLAASFEATGPTADAPQVPVTVNITPAQAGTALGSEVLAQMWSAAEAELDRTGMR